MKKDRKDTKCKCGGVYEERSLMDDWDGVVTCTKCDKQIERWSKK